jgi:hypothetical protein
VGVLRGQRATRARPHAPRSAPRRRNRLSAEFELDDDPDYAKWSHPRIQTPASSPEPIPIPPPQPRHIEGIIEKVFPVEAFLSDEWDVKVSEFLESANQGISTNVADQMEEEDDGEETPTAGPSNSG